jgi:hypothetical protein
MRVDSIERHALALIGSGCTDAEFTTEVAIDDYDTWLNSEPEQVDTEKVQLLAALGVGPS